MTKRCGLGIGTVTTGVSGSTSNPQMTAEDVLEFLDLMSALGIHVWLDGGWAVDACLGHPTRRHSDLDLVIEDSHLKAAVASLAARGYKAAPRTDTRPWNFALGDDSGHEIDFHVVVLDASGLGIYGPPENGESYPAESLGGIGTIGGRSVACITPEWLVKFHTGYPLDAIDWADVSALCEKFGLSIPADYLPFQ